MGVPEETRPRGTTSFKGVGPGRPRRFRVTSQTLTRDSIVDALDRPNVVRYAGIVHDKDPGVRTHAHVVFALSEGRTLQTVANMFHVPPGLVRPVIGQKGDTHSFARAVRYLTHESPTEQAKGKYRYSDDEVFASIGYKWRPELDALSTREGFLPPLLDRLKLQVSMGERSADSVRDEYPLLYMKNLVAFRRLEHLFLTEYSTPAQFAASQVEFLRRMNARNQLTNGSDA